MPFVIERNHAHMHVRAVENPFLIADCEKYISRFFNSLQRFSICAAADCLRRKQTGALTIALLN